MKLWQTFRYELTYQSRSMSTWFYFLLLLVLSFLMAAVVFIDEPVAGGYFLNAPYIVTFVCLIAFFFLGLLTLAPFAGNAAARDLETGIYSLLYASPISKAVYLGGRFLAAFVLGSIVMMAIPLGVLIGAFFPFEHAELSGPMNWLAYLSTWFLLIVPNTFITVAFMFTAAVLNRKGIISYLIAVIIGVTAILSWQLLGAQQDNWALADLADPVGITIMQHIDELWTANQKNTLLPAMERSTLLNRLLWLTVAAVMLLITYLRFNTSIISRKDKTAEKKRKVTSASANENDQSYHVAAIAIPHVSKSFDLSTRRLQLFTIARESFRLIVFGWGWMAMAGMFAFVLLTGPMWFSDYHDIQDIPVTGNLVGNIENVMEHGIWLVIPLLIIYYAGELVWRERDARLHEITGAAPVPVWVSFAGKFFGMLLSLVIMQLLLMVAGMMVQMLLGYYDFQIPVYLKILLGIRLVDYVLLAVLAFSLHVLLNQKYMAHFISVLFYLFKLFGPQFGIESGLFMYGSDPGWSYSDLRGLYPFLEPWLYFKMYWGAWAMLLAVVMIVLWPRGTANNNWKRFQQGILNSNPKIKILAGISLLMILIVGGFIHYNTHYLYPTTAFVETLEYKAAYEKQYGQYSSRPQPSVTDVKLQVEIFPEKGAVEFKGNFLLVNKNASAIDTVFISTAPGVVHHQLRWNRPVKSQMLDEELNFMIYQLEKPLVAGDSLQLEFHVEYDPKGFPYNGMKTLVVSNGTYFEDEWLPWIGYLNSRQIFNPNDRNKYGLEPRSFLETDEETFAQQRVAFEAIVGTDKGQTAVAPGRLLKSWTEEDRSYFHYATEHVVNNKFAFFSSNYQVYNTQWKQDSGQVVAISILHHPRHTHNLHKMAKGVQASLKYLTGALGKYPHSEIRFTEVPGYNKGLHAYPTNIFYREGFALMKPEEDPGGIDIVFATTAHEVAHQWWGHQVSPAPIKGAALITESLAWFSAFEIVEQAQGDEALAKLLDLARDDYFSPQERAADPLLQANQTSLIYRKGPLALYALREYIGKEKVGLALQDFFRQYSAVEGTRPVPSDLYKALQVVTPDSMQYLLHDLFATNTFWELKTEKVAATQTETGKWKVTLDVLARKFTVDQKGNETDVTLNDWIQVGVYPEGEGKQPLYLHPHRIHSGRQTIEIELTQKPHAAGIDPNFLLMDVKRWDNVIDVQLK